MCLHNMTFSFYTAVCICTDNPILLSNVKSMLEFPRGQCDIFKLLLLSNSSNPKYINNDIKTSAANG